MSIQNSIESKIKSEFEPVVFQLENESHRHSGPATESHFKLTLVAERFSELNRVKRHQAVYNTLAEELAGGVHALALHLFSPQEWEEEGGTTPDSPDCRGGSKAG